MGIVSLTLTKGQHAALHAHLFPGDGLEAVSLLLCGRRRGVYRHRLVVQKIFNVPYEQCSVRTPNRVTWSTQAVPEILNEAVKNGLGVVKIHGHDLYRAFSEVDNASDRALFPSVYAWTGSQDPHASAIMMADGQVFGRVWKEDGTSVPIDRVAVVGDDIQFWDTQEEDIPLIPEYGRRVAQVFGKGTFAQLRRLKIGVIGCSGTGSPVVEMLARNCVGDLVLVDPDNVEEKNLNRILNSRMIDAKSARPKVDVLAEAVAEMGLGVRVHSFAKTLFHRDVVRALADCDIVFGCMDSVDGRHLLNKLATFYSIPYFDLGVKIIANGNGGVDQVCGTVHYLQPGGSSLLSRGVYTMEQVRAAGLARTDPAGYERNRAEGYIQGVAEDRPAVIQLNMLIASLAVNEVLARVHPYRLDPNGDYAAHRISLSHGIYEHEQDGRSCSLLSRHVGRGDVEPLLDWPELSQAGAQ